MIAMFGDNSPTTLCEQYLFNNPPGTYYFVSKKPLVEHSVQPLLASFCRSAETQIAGTDSVETSGNVLQV